MKKTYYYCPDCKKIYETACSCGLEPVKATYKKRKKTHFERPNAVLECQEVFQEMEERGMFRDSGKMQQAQAIMAHLKSKPIEDIDYQKVGHPLD